MSVSYTVTAIEPGATQISIKTLESSNFLESAVVNIPTVVETEGIKYGVQFDGINSAGTRLYDAVDKEFTVSIRSNTGKDDFTGLPEEIIDTAIKYGVEFDGTNSAGTRLYDAVDKQFIASTSTTTGIDDFTGLPEPPPPQPELIALLHFNENLYGKNTTITDEVGNTWRFSSYNTLTRGTLGTFGIQPNSNNETDTENYKFASCGRLRCELQSTSSWQEKAWFNSNLSSHLVDLEDKSFTIDFWLKYVRSYYTDYGGQRLPGVAPLVYWVFNEDAMALGIYSDANTNSALSFNPSVKKSGTTTRVNGTTDIYANNDNKFHHIALTYDDVQKRCVVYFDGVAQLSCDFELLFGNDTDLFYVLGVGDDMRTLGSQYYQYQCFMAEFAMCKGLRWTSNFTPPTAPYSI